MSLGAAGQPEVQSSFNHTQHTHANLDINMYISTAIQSLFYIFYCHCCALLVVQGFAQCGYHILKLIKNIMI